SEQHTALVIAHRLSTIVDADHIVVMHHGELVEQGNHQQLLERQGYYANMWRLQQQVQQPEQKPEQQPL
ncbi:MAG: metal ABC transporter permease, partial [Pseudomonadota bacterium]